MLLKSTSFAAIAFLASSLTLACIAEDTPSIQHIREQYASSLKVLDHLDVVYHVDSVYKPAFFRLGAIKDKGNARREAHLHYRVLTDGDKWRIENRPSWFINSTAEARSDATFDGTRRYFLAFPPGETGVPHSLSINYAHKDPDRLRTRGDLDSVVPSDFDGTTIAELLSEPERIVIASDDVDGHRCWKLDCGNREYADKARVHVQLWLDPSVEYLPRKIQVTKLLTRSIFPDSTEPTELFETKTVKEFIQLSSGQYLPRMAEMDGLFASHVITVESADIPSGLPLSVFQLTAPLGTRVDEMDLQGNLLIYNVGESKDPEARLRQLAQQVKKAAENPPKANDIASSPAKPAVIVTADNRGNLRYVLWAGAAALMFAAMFFWKKQRG